MTNDSMEEECPTRKLDSELEVVAVEKPAPAAPPPKKGKAPLKRGGRKK